MHFFRLVTITVFQILAINIRICPSLYGTHSLICVAERACVRTSLFGS